jgi:hypothetical protein
MRWRGCAGRRDSRERTALSLADPFAVAEAAYATIATFLQSEEAQKVKHSDLERQLEAMGRDLMRKLLQAHLELRQPGVPLVTNLRLYGAESPDKSLYIVSRM